ncbi:MAG: glycosyltransferase family 2 protein [Elusimicrobiota bacterium]|jgi:glycosyltransferase involved in cell wall biosynthesis|nr:glycosyltransferase family 2 protein [Elusimicrobiota bacterium]
MEKRSKVIIVMPAYNAQKTLKQTLDDIPQGSFDEIILVDDFSKDETIKTAKELGLKVIVHDRNKGYGGNQKTCYREALKDGADIVVMLHPDYQYDPRLVPFLAGIIEAGVCDIMLASRIRTRKETLDGGMPKYKYLSNRILTVLENFVLGFNLGEFHSGYRAFSRQALEKLNIDFCSDDFVFDQEILAQAAVAGLRVGDIPVTAKYFPEASSINFSRSVSYGLGILLLMAKYILFKTGIYTSKLFEEKR